MKTAIEVSFRHRGWRKVKLTGSVDALQALKLVALLHQLVIPNEHEMEPRRILGLMPRSVGAQFKGPFKKRGEARLPSKVIAEVELE